jgi:5S rRNA maturation endonuclease (ribonuclease M5)
METYKIFCEFITRLREKSQRVPVIVEGKNDEKFLKRFGIKNIYTLSGKITSTSLRNFPKIRKR